MSSASPCISRIKEGKSLRSSEQGSLPIPIFFRLPAAISIWAGCSDHRTVKTTSDFTYKEKQIHTNMASVDFDYLKTFGLKPIEGREFDKSYGTDTLNNIMISASVARQMNEKNLIGKIIGADSSFQRLAILLASFRISICIPWKKKWNLVTDLRQKCSAQLLFHKNNGAKSGGRYGCDKETNGRGRTGPGVYRIFY